MMSAPHSILVIDDSEIEHISIKYTIEEYDPSIEILSAYDGGEALELLTNCSKPPDIIFVDINMPGMDGHEFLNEYAKKDDESLTSVIVMLTSSDQNQDREKSSTHKFIYDYITKPLDTQKINLLFSEINK